MTLAPRQRASIAMLLAIAGFAILAMKLPDQWATGHFKIYFGLAMMASIVLIYAWTYHWYAQKSPAAHPTSVGLGLTIEKFPKYSLLALIPPTLVALALWWLFANASEVPWEFAVAWEDSPHSRTAVRGLVGQILLLHFGALWTFMLGLALWYGMARRYQIRRGLLKMVVFNQWLALAFSCDLLLRSLRVPVAVGAIAGIARAAALCAIILMVWRSHQLWKQSPSRSTWFYFDTQDPTLLGERGVNVACGWFWLLVATAAVMCGMSGLVLASIPQLAG